eukprot:gnl/MRDRNA2_/MRDRNA2_126200_c0_seq1.p1 gnl/MRDRNA2_/MRDRNA2_126200_c0~~gnl/MRDRNA2_/MRDRNA2_126200_c0_seq1.p1  ORF type:complete len:426 (-),score=95.77 gnl/MRDRNA2_/MRDRNA2_126200_c0_seq1:152-1429(-)
MMEQVDHPNMLKLHHRFEDARYVYLVLEYCSGGMLLDRCISQGSFNEKEAAIIARQIFAACHYLHDTIRMVHRDIKLENFLFSNEDHATAPGNHLKMIDFGEATKLHGQPLTTRIGTPFYVAPEVLKGSYDEKADMWSSGVLTYILLVGYPPFAGSTPQEITEKVAKGYYVFDDDHWSRISEDAKDLVACLLRYNPKERWSAADTLEHVWILHEAPRAQLHRQTWQNTELLGKLQSFQTKNQFDKLALNALAWNLSEQHLTELQELFICLDVNDDGQLTVEELQGGLEQAGFRSASQELLDIMEKCDADGNGVLDYTEFIAATIDRKRDIEEDICWRVFRVFDVSHTGKITAHDLENVLKNDDVQEVMMVQPDFIESLIKDVDLNGDGMIDFEEFMVMLRGENASNNVVASAARTTWAMLQEEAR